MKLFSLQMTSVICKIGGNKNILLKIEILDEADRGSTQIKFRLLSFSNYTHSDTRFCFKGEVLVKELTLFVI